MIRPAHRLSSRRAVLLVAAAVAMALGPSAALAADLFYSATLGLPIGDDARFFLNLTNQHYAAPAPLATSIVRRCPRPEDDFPVVMMLAHAAGRPVDAVLSLRLRGLSWAEVMTRIDLSPRVLFVGLDHDPGPPYGHAWGHWKSHGDRPGAERAAPYAIADAQVVDLAKLQIASAYYRVSPYTIVGERQRGVTVERFAVMHGRPSGSVDAANHSGGPQGGKRPAKGHGNGHGQGDGAEHHHP